jgi:hypothetical protein
MCKLFGDTNCCGDRRIALASRRCTGGSNPGGFVPDSTAADPRRSEVSEGRSRLEYPLGDNAEKIVDSRTTSASMATD